MNKKKLITYIIGGIILIFIISKIGPLKLIETLKNFNFIYLPLIIITLLFGFVLSAINTWVLCWPFKKISLIKIIKYTFFTAFFAIFIPGKLADLLMIHFLRKEDLTMNQSTITVFFDKIISLFAKVILGLIGAIFILKQFNFLFIGIPLITLAIIILILLAVNSKVFVRFIKKYVLRKYSSIWKGISKDLKDYKNKYKIYLGYNFFVTLIKSFFEALLFFLLFLSFGQHTNIVEVFFVFALLSILILLAFPIGISGLGIRELMGITIFSTIGIDPAVVFNSFMLRITIIYIYNFGLFIKYHDELNILKKNKIWERIKF
jgi:uncharacterized protein (TIRG00374 family)